ncbi:MAG: magnesium transporter [Catalinimonas sp.]
MNDPEARTTPSTDNYAGFELTRAFLDEIEAAVEARDAPAVRERLQPLHPADISAVLDELDTEEAKFVVDHLDRDLSADILTNVEPETRRRFLKSFTPAELAEYMYHIDSDDAADILNEQPIQVREEIIAHIQDAQVAHDVLDLLRYEEDHAGGLMAKELVKCNVNWDVKQCIEEIRRQAEEVERLYSVYVVDDGGKLLGRVSLKRLLLAHDRTPVADVYEPDVVTVESYRHAEEVAEIMRRYDLEAIPVVNVQGRLLGRITIDDIVDVITEQAEKDQQIMSGITENAEDPDSVWSMARSRLPWLMIGMMGGLLGARFIGLFEDDLAIIPAMAFFIPLVTATGGNVGIQSSTVVVQSLANKSALSEALAARMLKVVGVALINALVISMTVFGFVYIGESFRLAVVVGVALFAVVLLASLMGTITPLVLEHFGINPALASGPFITTANDLLGLGVYFAVAHQMYQL